MTKLTIQHEWKTYSWIGDKWGVWEITKIRIEKWDISPDTPMVQVEMNTMWKNTNHSIDQLVKLWYMELQPQEEKTEQSILSKLRAELERMKPEYTDGRPYLKWANDTIEQIISLLNELQTQPEEYCYRDKDWKPIEFELAKSWPPLSQVPIEIPEFDYEEIVNYSFKAYDTEQTRNDHVESEIGKQVERITKYLRENK